MSGDVVEAAPAGISEEPTLTIQRPLPAVRRLNTVEAAAFLALSPSTMEKMRGGDAGPPFAAMGRRITYALADLEAWAAARTVRDVSEARMTTPRRLTPARSVAGRNGHER